MAKITPKTPKARLRSAQSRLLEAGNKMTKNPPAGVKPYKRGISMKQGPTLALENVNSRLQPIRTALSKTSSRLHVTNSSKPIKPLYTRASVKQAIEYFDLNRAASRAVGVGRSRSVNVKSATTRGNAGVVSSKRPGAKPSSIGFKPQRFTTKPGYNRSKTGFKSVTSASTPRAGPKLVPSGARTRTTSTGRGPTTPKAFRSAPKKGRLARTSNTSRTSSISRTNNNISRTNNRNPNTGSRTLSRYSKPTRSEKVVGGTTIRNPRLSGSKPPKAGSYSGARRAGRIVGNVLRKGLGLTAGGVLATGLTEGLMYATRKQDVGGRSGRNARNKGRNLGPRTSSGAASGTGVANGMINPNTSKPISKPQTPKTSSVKATTSATKAPNTKTKTFVSMADVGYKKPSADTVAKWNQASERLKKIRQGHRSMGISPNINRYWSK